tara:strand:+ start:2237 stop:2593 length:357 start_codon:yes stop_codon:yes gene_type:complete
MTKEIKQHGNKKTIDFNVLDALVQFKVTKIFVADYLDVSPDTIERRIKEHSGMTFTEYSNLKQQRTGLKLQQKCVELALKGDRTLMIFALKNMAGWADKLEQTHDVGKETKKLIIDME